MTDKEIIKAFECCEINLSCDGCPNYLNGKTTARCVDGFHENVLNLINRQKAENERLKKSNEMFTDIGKMYSEIKAEAVKEFAERLKPILFNYYDGDIDNLLKEMVGEE